MGYFFLYDSTTGAIIAANTTGFTPGSGESVLGPLTDNTAAAAYVNPGRYLVQNGALVAQPYLTLAASAPSNGAVTLTATLNDPPATPPADVTFTVAGNTFTEAFANGTATLTVDVHPSVAQFAIPASVAATGCVGAQTTFGGTQQAPVALQCAPLVGGTVPTVTPCGTGSLAYLQNFAGASSIPAEHVLGDVATADAISLDALCGTNGALAALQAAGIWKPTTAQSAGLAWVRTNVLPSLPVTLATILDSSGHPVQPAAQFAADQAAAATAFGNFAQWVATMTNLA